MTSLSILRHSALCGAILRYCATEQLPPPSSRQVTMQNWGLSWDQSTGFLNFLGDREQKVEKRLLNTKIRHFLTWGKLQMFQNCCWFFSHQKHLCFAHGLRSKAVCSERNADSEEGLNYNQCWQILKGEIANFSTTTHKQCKFCFPSLPIFACDPSLRGLHSREVSAILQVSQHNPQNYQNKWKYKNKWEFCLYSSKMEY